LYPISAKKTDAGVFQSGEAALYPRDGSRKRPWKMKHPERRRGIITRRKSEYENK
jgi:hypothetical protein